MATLSFDPSSPVAAQILNAWPGKTQNGNDKCDAKIQIETEAGPAELKASAGPLFAYLTQALVDMAKTPDTAYNVRLQQNGDYLNIVGIDGVEAPAGWDEAMRKKFSGGGGGNAAGSGGQASGRKDPMTVRMHCQTIAARLYPPSGPELSAILSGNWTKWDAIVDHLVGQVYGTKPKAPAAPANRAPAQEDEL